MRSDVTRPSSMSSRTDQLSKTMFFLSLAFLVVFLAFAYGVAVGWKVWPHGHLRVALDHARSLHMAGKWQPRDRFIWAPPGAGRERITIYRPESLEAGYRAIMGWDGARYGIWLIDAQGQDAHYWPIEYRLLDPDGPATEEPHGMKLLEDGSVLVNFDRGNALARLDECGQPVWVKRGIFHHSIDRAEDGTFWTWRADHTAYGPYQYLVNFDAEDGQTVNEYSLIDDFVDVSADQRMIFGIPEGYDYSLQSDDVFHPNDIEPLYSSMADAFPAFRAGDLLVSFRSINLVAVLAPNERKVRWWSHGPWRAQHDPDFTSDGKIIVYNNNRDRGISNIITVDPTSQHSEVAYADGEVRYYSGTAGKHQRLPHGGILIVVPDEGRVLELSSAGDLVLEFNNRWSEKVNAYIVNAAWVPMTFFDDQPACHAVVR